MGPPGRPARRRPPRARSPSCAGWSRCSAPTSAWRPATSWPPPATSRARWPEYAAAHAEQPDNAELAFWHGVTLAATGREPDARAQLERVYASARAGASCCAACLPAGLFPRRPRADRSMAVFHRPREDLRARRRRRQRVVSFRREAHVPKGGPDGGDGGRGGDVVLVVDASLRDLAGVPRGAHCKADRGGHGEGSNKHGATRRRAGGPRAAGHRGRGPRARRPLGPDSAGPARGRRPRRQRRARQQALRRPPRARRRASPRRGLPGEERWLDAAS